MIFSLSFSRWSTRHRRISSSSFPVLCCQLLDTCHRHMFLPISLPGVLWSSSSFSKICLKYNYGYFGGPGRAIGRVCVCVCVCVRTITFELGDLRSRYMAWWFIRKRCRSYSKIKVTGQSSQSQKETITQQLLRRPTVARKQTRIENC